MKKAGHRARPFVGQTRSSLASGLFQDFVDLGSNIEASPAVFENTVVVGTRANGIWGVTMK